MTLIAPQLYEKMVHCESTLVLVNPPGVTKPMFDAGQVPVPRSLMMRFMTEIVDDEELLRGLGSCTINETAELARLTMARDKSPAVQGLHFAAQIEQAIKQCQAVHEEMGKTIGVFGMQAQILKTAYEKVQAESAAEEAEDREDENLPGNDESGQD